MLDLFCRQTQEAQAARFKALLAFSILSSPRPMNASVNLHYQPGFRTVEVDDVAGDSGLPPELEAV
jgi:hypothetical protein